VAKQYLALYQEIQHLHKEMQDLELTLQYLFAKEGVEEIRVSSFILKKEGERIAVEK
jgi:hypothetical protein